MASTAGKLIVAGGIGDSEGEALSSVEVFDLATQCWSEVEALPVPYSWCHLVLLEDPNRVFILGQVHSNCPYMSLSAWSVLRVRCWCSVGGRP